MRVLRTAIVFVLAVALTACAERSEDTELISWPVDSWEGSTPREEGLNAEQVAGFLRDLEEGAYGPLDRFLLIRHGRLVADARFEVDWTKRAPEGASSAPYVAAYVQYDYDDPDHHPYFRGTRLHSMQSVTKSVISLGIGTALLAGKIRDLDEPIAPYFREFDFGESHPDWTDVTIADLLTMRSGISWETEGGYGTGEHSTDILENSAAWLPFILSRPMDAEPGSVFEYNDGVSVLLGHVLGDATGGRADAWLASRLFAPIGIDEYHWKESPNGELDTQGGLYLASEDLARIGYLVLRNGKWDGRTILPEDWITASMRTSEDLTVQDRQTLGFGYHWWVRRISDNQIVVFEANGYGGQRLIIVPSLDVVAVFNAWDIHGDHAGPAINAFYEKVLPNIVE